MALQTAFLNDLLARYTEADRAEAEAVLAKIDTNPEAQKAINDAVKRQSEFSRGMDQLDQERARVAQHKANLDTWFEQNRGILAVGVAASAAGWKPGQPDPDPNPNPAPQPQPVADFLKREDVEKLVGEREVGAAEYMDAIMALGVRHFQTFGEVLNVRELRTDPRVAKLGIQGVYDAKYADRYQERATKAENDRIEQQVQARLAEERKKFSSRPPYPVAPNDVSPLDALTTPDKSQFSAEAAADEYQALVAKRA